MGALNPKASEVMNLLMGRPVPAKAQAPRGQKFIRSLQSTSRPASRSSYSIKCKFINLLVLRFIGMSFDAIKINSNIRIISSH